MFCSLPGGCSQREHPCCPAGADITSDGVYTIPGDIKGVNTMSKQLQLGRVKWYDAKEGYGFISPVNGGDDIRVTRNGIANSRNKLLCEGQEVEFSLTRGSYGIAANDVIAL